MLDQACCEVIGGRLHYFSFVVGEGEYALGNLSVYVIFVEEEVVLLLILGNLQKVEIVEDFLLLFLPVLVMEVIANPHEPLVNELGDN
jgi:hypothetical protein